MNTNIKSFYEGKTILLTGTTGFVGKVMLEKLLRSVPTLNQIILLMRSKQNQSITKRFIQTTIASPVFDRLKKELGENFEEYIKNKVKLVEGDLLAQNLGLSDESRQYIQENCHVIVNCAASIDFNAKLIDSINTNVMGTLQMYNMAKNCIKLENFVHISTCYVNCDKFGFIEEIIYESQSDPEVLLQKFLNMPKQQLEQQTPQIIGKYPNTYTFTKSLAEKIIKKIKPASMPVTIVRPSIVGSAAKEPFKGWVESLSASTAAFTFIGTGVVKYIASTGKNIGDIVPVDLVANYTIIAGAIFANQQEINVCHASTSAGNPMYWSVPKEIVEKYWQTNPPEKKAGPCNISFLKNTQRVEMVQKLTQNWPIQGYKYLTDKVGTQQMQKGANRAVKIAKRAQTIQDVFCYFSSNEWIFDDKNNVYIQKILSQQDKEEFWIDPKMFNWQEYLIFYQWGIHRYLLNENVPTPLVSDILLASRRTYFSDIQWALEKGKKLKTRGQKQYKSMVLNSQKVIAELNHLVDHRTTQAQQQFKTHKKVSLEKIKAQCKQDAVNLANEMIADYNTNVLRMLAWGVHKIFRVIYEKVTFDDTVLRQIQHHDEKVDGPIIFIPTHRSYIDFIMVSYILFAFQIQCPHIAAAEDFLKMAIVPHFLRMCGAFFLRRKLQEDLQPLYKAMLHEYVTRLLMDNCYLEFFIEGTRSRNFKTLPPKFGILGTIVDGIMEDKIKDALIIPLTINYEKVLEEDTYPYELMGEEKVKESTMRLLKAAKVLKENYGKIFIEFCEPIPAKQYIQSQSHNGLDKKEIINNLGYEITYRIVDNLVITIPSIVSSILLMHRKGIMEHILVSKVEWIVDKIIERNAKVGSVTTKSEHSGVAQAVRQALLLLENNLHKSKKTVFEMSVAPIMDFKNILMLSYYRNGLQHLFFQEAIYCVALCSFGQSNARSGVKLENYWKETQFLLQLLNREHVSKRQIKTYEQFLEFLTVISDQYKVLSFDREQGTVKIQDEQMVTFLCSQCWFTVESYWITCVYFFTLKQTDNLHIVKEFQMPQYIQWFSENLYDENIIEYNESSSLDMLKNAVQTFAQLGVIVIENESNIKNQGIVKLNINEPDLQKLEQRLARFLKRNYQANTSMSPIDLARRTVLAEYNPKL